MPPGDRYRRVGQQLVARRAPNVVDEHPVRDLFVREQSTQRAFVYRAASQWASSVGSPSISAPRDARGPSVPASRIAYRLSNAPRLVSKYTTTRGSRSTALGRASFVAAAARPRHFAVTRAPK